MTDSDKEQKIETNNTTALTDNIDMGEQLIIIPNISYGVGENLDDVDFSENLAVNARPLGFNDTEIKYEQPTEEKPNYWYFQLKYEFIRKVLTDVVLSPVEDNFYLHAFQKLKEQKEAQKKAEQAKKPEVKQQSVQSPKQSSTNLYFICMK